MTNHPPFAKRPSTFTQSRHAVHCSFACVRYTVHAGVNQIYCTKITGALIAHSSHHKWTRSNPVWFVCTRTLYLLSSLYINRYNVFVYYAFIYTPNGVYAHTFALAIYFRFPSILIRNRTHGITHLNSERGSAFVWHARTAHTDPAAVAARRNSRVHLRGGWPSAPPPVPNK